VRGCGDVVGCSLARGDVVTVVEAAASAGCLRIGSAQACADRFSHALLQVCERQSSDKKGGHLARRKKDGRLV
jgi:hypothetical protein